MLSFKLISAKLFFVIFCVLQGSSQIIYPIANYSSVGDIAYRSNFNPDLNLDFYDAGPNFNWDFSSILYSGQDSLVNSEVNQTPFAYQLFFNNIFLYPNHVANFAQKGLDIDAVPNLQITDRFDYFRTSSSSLKKVGFGANINGLPASVRYDTIETIFNFPLSYGDADSSRAYYLASLPSLGAYGQWIRREYEVDGWGSLQTPFQTYDVIRVRTTIKQRDTLYVDQFQFGTTFDQPDITLLQWFSLNEGFPVLEVSFQGGFPIQSWYLDQLHVGVNDKETDITCYPNPTTDRVSFNANNLSKGFIVELLDGVGNQIFSCEECLSISLGHLSNGIYIVKVYSNKDQEVFRILKQ